MLSIRAFFIGMITVATSLAAEGGLLGAGSTKRIHCAMGRNRRAPHRDPRVTGGAARSPPTVMRMSCLAASVTGWPVAR